MHENRMMNHHCLLQTLLLPSSSSPCGRGHIQGLALTPAHLLPELPGRQPALLPHGTRPSRSVATVARLQAEGAQTIAANGGGAGGELEHLAGLGAGLWDVFLVKG